MNDKIINIQWFKKNIEPQLNEYILNYRFFEDGDLGSLSEVEIDSNRFGCAVDFWGKGWLGIFIWDNEKKEELLNILIEPTDKNKKLVYLNKMLQILAAPSENTNAEPLN